MPDSMQPEPARLFYSYAHEDEAFRDRLEKHLSVLQWQRLLAPWHDRQIRAGSEWAREIDEHLNTATIILLLISSDFLASDYCYDKELHRAMERHNAGEARVIPIILRPYSWQGTPFGKLQALPRDGKAITMWKNQDQAFLEVEQSLRLLIEQPFAHTFGRTAMATKNRENMRLRLQKMYKDLLDDSLQKVAWIELCLNEQPGAVQNAANLVLRRATQTAHALHSGTSILQVYQESNQELLILGAPGAGKSTLLYQLGRDLLNDAHQHPESSLPILFPLSSWAQTKRPLQEWMVEQLCSPLYQISRKQSEQWVQNQQILPLLDGLDEIEETGRSACITAINAYRRDHPLCPLVVCSRSEEYARAATQESLHLQNAIEVQPLAPEQLNTVLTQAGRPFAALHKELKKNTQLRELASSPLWLNIMLLTFKDTSVRALPRRRVTLQQQLFQQYIVRMVSHKGKEMDRANEKQYPLDQTVRWLSWLATQMRRGNQTVFSVEMLQPDWLEKQLQMFYMWSCRLSVGLIFGLSNGLIVGPIFGLVLGLVGVLGIGLGFGSSNKITLAERVRWSWKQVLIALIFGLILGLIGGRLHGLSFGLSFGLIVWVIIGLRRGLIPNTYIDRRPLSPSEGLRSSALNGLIFGLSIGVIGGLIGGLPFGLNGGLIGGLGFGLNSGLIFGLNNGLSAIIQHFLLRFWLRRTGRFPFQTGIFLEDARARHLLQRVGGSYRFVHPLLQDYFADLDQTATLPASSLAPVSAPSTSEHQI